MKKILVVMMVLSVALVACDAFKSSYDGVPAGAKVGGDTTGGANTGGAVGDISSDKTVCTPIKEVKVDVSKDPGAITTTQVGGDKVVDAVATAEKVGDYTTKISVTAAGTANLVLIIKQTAEKEYSLCGVNYNPDKPAGVSFKVSGGTITIDQFNKKSDKDKIINAGKFDLQFNITPFTGKSALDAMTEVAGLAPAADAAADDAISVEGTYFTDKLVEAQKPAAASK